MQDKLLRTLILNCIGQCVATYLRRCLPDNTTNKWLARTLKPVLVNLRKANFQFPEQQVRSIRHQTDWPAGHEGRGSVLCVE